MGRNKPTALKRRLGRANKFTRRAPIWVMTKTKGKIRANVKHRSWRRQKLKP